MHGYVHCNHAGKSSKNPRFRDRWDDIANVCMDLLIDLDLLPVGTYYRYM